MSAHNPFFNEEHIPLAYFITFRCYGTWRHGDERGSTDRYNNKYSAPFIEASQRWKQHNQNTRKHPPVTLDADRRTAVEAGIRETCKIREWQLKAVNVRTNHVHIVVSASGKPEPILTAFKANATRKIRENKSWTNTHSPWAEKGSRRYLWTERSVERAIDYTLNGQGDEIPDFNEEDE
jgi:REP element-mobilizing transposase RayT